MSLCIAISLSFAASFWSELLPGAKSIAAEARRHHSHAASGASTGSRHRHASGGVGGGSTHSRSSRHHHGAGRLERTAHAGHGKHARHVVADKHAYPLDFFMMHAPDFERSPFDEPLASKIQDSFTRGTADDSSAEKMVRAGVFHFHPLSGGIFKRREDVKYIVLHSTETGIPVPGRNVINGWNSMGRRHPGAQFVVDRDGTIYLAVDPDLATVHVNIFKTLPGINNDNSIGIEMNHTGRQDYPAAQRQSVMRLVTYLQNRFKVTSDNVITHRYAQQGDHTDPVNFPDLESFLAGKDDFRNRAIALRRSSAPPAVEEETEDDAPLASVYVQIHGILPEPSLGSVEYHKRQRSIAHSGASPANNSPDPTFGGAATDPAIAMPRGTYVAGGSMKTGSSPANDAPIPHY